ncbi:hypothetical protein JCM5350_006277 [Sporobolomyces pararoseus]
MTSTSDTQTPSNLSSTRYFDLLPTELVGHIFNNLDEKQRTKESQKTLLSLCLTSKLCRSHAHPLLLKTIRTSIGNYPGLLQKLVENNSDATISMVEGFHFDTEDLKNIKKWLVKFIQKATNLQEVSVMKQVTPLKAFFGSSTSQKAFSLPCQFGESRSLFNVSLLADITTLSLRHITMKLDGAVLSFPELLKLSLQACPIHNDGGIRFSLPKLKHLALFSGTSHLWPQEIDFLAQLLPTRVSFTVSLEKISTLPPSVLNSPTLSILFEAHSGGETPSTLQGVRKLVLRLRGDGPDTVGPSPKINANIQYWTSLISDSNHQLETVYLSVYGLGSNVHPGIKQDVDALVTACTSLNLEVVWFEQGDPNAFDFNDRVPALFVKRAEARFTGRRTGGGAES